MVNKLNDYIHEYDFPYHDFLKNYKNELLAKYFSLISNKKSLTDFFIPIDHPLNIYIQPKLNELIQKNYWVDTPTANLSLRTYIQNNKNNQSFYHNHPFASSISGVFYVDPPQKGGELSFIVDPNKDPNSSEGKIIIKPQKNKLYLFPYWLYHKPCPQEDEDYRICFNFMYGSPSKPIHKMSAIQW